MARRGMGAFAKGLIQGYMMADKLERERKLHDLEVEKRLEEKAFREQLKAANQDLTPTEQFTVVTPDGTTQVFDDQETAFKAMEGVDGASLSRSFLVGDQRFDDPERAQYAARQANSEIGKLERQARVAFDFGQPQMATQLAQAADQIRQTRSRAITDSILEYQKSGNVEGMMQMFDQQFDDGGKTRLVEQDGGYMLVRNVNGRDVPLMPRPVGSIPEVFETAALAAQTNAYNIVDVWKFKQTHGLNVRRQDEAERHNRVSEGISAGHLGVAQAGLNMRQQEHAWAKQDRLNPKPETRVYSDPSGNVVPVTFNPSRNPDGSWNAPRVQPGSPLPGVQVRPQQEDPLVRMQQALNAGGKTPSLADGLTPEHLKAFGDYLTSKRPPTAPAAPAAAPRTPAPAANTGGGLQLPPEVERAADPYGFNNLPYGR